MVPKLDDRKEMEIGHFGEQQTLAKICKGYYWHNRTEQVRATFKIYK